MAEDIYDIDTASTPRGDGIRDLVLTDRWNTPLGKPNGGYILAAMLRGLGEEMEADDPMVAAISYLASPETGAAELRTTALRRGRRVQTGEAALWEGDRHIAHLLASFGARTGGRSVELGTPPALPAPDECFDPKDFPDALPSSSIFDRVDYRLTEAPGWALGEPSGDPTAELWQRLAGGREIDFPALAFLCDAYAPPVLEIGEFMSMTVQLTVHLHRRPVPGWIATRLTTRHVINGYHEEDCELWDEAGNLVAQSRQLAILLS
ncbi:acyl-CoA thioesterase [Aeromicrobium panaciterrae]|uniref:Acyl-CoA thioesterase n=1 Tax=Aeromicrobium panaciterrae TaxID=363861 RepID=A0ABU1UQA3_9ACTN|nr:thioesterase family protein [Aeromicrobium panaciterrae]MDR7087356.1 acyl-CoA thioesterase [Aeromicrobium panaciterrae]